MVLQREGKGKNFSPHSVKLSKTKSLPKWGGMIRIASLYYISSILMLSEWKKLEESTCKAILAAGPSLENWGREPFGAILRHQTLVFGQKTIESSQKCSSHQNLSNSARITSIRTRMRKLCLPEVDLP
jgi:hypothetical protein